MRTRIIYLLLFILINIGIAFKLQWLFYEKGELYSYLLIGIIALINPGLIYLILKNWEWKGITTFILVFVFAFIHTLIHENYTESQLHNGEQILGIITDKEWSKGSSRKDGEWLIRGMFEYNNNKYYTYFEPIKDASKNINDSIVILFSTSNPNINRLLIETADNKEE